MKLPELLYGNNKTRRQTVAFGGVNYSENHVEGEWEQTENLGSGRWPALAPRLGRAVARECEAAPTALYAWEELASVEGTGFYYGGKYIGEVSVGPKQMVRVGDQIVIWPDKKYYNWKTGAFTSLAAAFTLDMGNQTCYWKYGIGFLDEEWDFVETGPGIRYDTGWLGVESGQRNRTYWVGAVSIYAEKTYIDRLVVGNTIYEGEKGALNTLGKVTQTRKESREYLPGVYRDYVTVTYEDLSGAQQELKDWAYTTNQNILRAAYEPDWSGGKGYRLRTEGKWISSEEYYEYWTFYGPQFSLHLNGDIMAQNGDILYYDETSKTGQKITAIDRRYYTDHNYTVSYTLVPVRMQKIRDRETPESICARLGVNIGDAVRVTRGNKTTDTKIAGFVAPIDEGDIWLGERGTKCGISFTDQINLSGAGDVSISRITEPNLDYVCVHDNRLWGVNEGKIWCSKFGNPQNFDVDSGTDADAWWAEVGSPGDWTGIVSYSGSVLAFKENLVHKVVGDLPSEFTISTYNIAGIQPGSHQSAAIVNEVLYYKGTNGVYAYSGYTPAFISANFGERKFREAVGGTDGARYYISMQDAAGEWQLYCYDTIRGVWLREDGLHAAAFSLHDGKLYCAAEDEGAILTFGEVMESDVPWSAVSVPFYESTFDRKLYTKLLIRAELPAGSTIRVAVSYDGGAWQELYNTRVPRWKVAILPVRPKRCDSFRLKIEGEGDITLRGIAREVLTGSER